MPFEIICSKCGTVLYLGFDLKSPRDVLKATNNKCKGCGANLNYLDFKVEVTEI
ncbi:MAG: hypothetical protein QXX95_07635 [Nitrososphaerales archaeon]